VSGKKPARFEGIVRRIVRDKGFGFIQGPDGVELFFHRSTLVAGAFDRLREGARVTYTAVESMKGPRAADVTVHDDE